MHTPGPWNIVRSLTCGHLRAAHNYQQDPQLEFTDADITLIEAAPALFAALQAIMADPPAWTTAAQCDAYDKARAAIAKATAATSAEST